MDSRTCQYRMVSIHWSVAEYNNNNAWYYNGNNGRLNNNNKYNTNIVRPFLAQYRNNDNLLECYPIPYLDFFNNYIICRRRKSNKASHLIFEMNRAEELIELCHEVNLFRYQQRESIVFVITKPKVREVIAADFRDRVVQTILVQRLLPYFEKHEHRDSYSCRVGKGGLAAALQFREYVKQMSNNYTEDCYVFSLDIKAFFPSIDTALWTRKLLEFIDENYEGDDAELIAYLIKSIYLYKPQNNCVKMSPQRLFDLVPPNKTMLGKDNGKGVPIGNVTSQTLANFITTLLLVVLERQGILFVCYTDDIKGVVKDKGKILRLLPYLRKITEQKLHLTLHPDKFDIQHYSHGIRVGGFKIRFDRMLPNDRIAHNWLHKTTTTPVDKCQEIVAFGNSYLGMMRHQNTYRLRKQGVDNLLSRGCDKYITINDDYTVLSLRDSIKPTSTSLARMIKYKRINNQELNKIA